MPLRASPGRAGLVDPHIYSSGAMIPLIWNSLAAVCTATHIAPSDECDNRINLCLLHVDCFEIKVLVRVYRARVVSVRAVMRGLNEEVD